jgi:hypothetical protein
MTRHERNFGVHAVPRYDVDTLGAPFRVTLLDSVTIKMDGDKEIVNIPDLCGLISAVVRTRVCHPRKLGGAELKFIRRALSVRSNELAKFLSMSAEHWSRCENGMKVLSANSEKEFRLFSYIATFIPNPQEALVLSADPKALKKKATKPTKMLEGLFEMFLLMKIESAFDPHKKLHFEFVRRRCQPELDLPNGDEDDEWAPEPARAA